MALRLEGNALVPIMEVLADLKIAHGYFSPVYWVPSLKGYLVAARKLAATEEPMSGHRERVQVRQRIDALQEADKTKQVIELIQATKLATAFLH